MCHCHDNLALRPVVAKFILLNHKFSSFTNSRKSDRTLLEDSVNNTRKIGVSQDNYFQNLNKRLDNITNNQIIIDGKINELEEKLDLILRKFKS